MTSTVLLTIIIVVLSMVVFLLLIKFFSSKNPQGDSTAGLDMLNRSVQSLTSQVTQILSDTNRNVGERLDNTARVVGDVRQKLGQLEEASKRVIQIGEDMSKLQDILKPPKLRGGLGESLLHDLLAQILPAENFALQYKFKGGETVDAVIILSKGLVPVDAKFPLDNFKKILEAGNPDERKALRKAFIRDVKMHIDDISSKYIRMDENTFDFAMMYIPAENVYYETIIKDDDTEVESLAQYALKKRVISVSPNSFYAYLQTIILGLRGIHVEEQAREILENLSRIEKEFQNFAELFRLVGQHIDNSAKKFAEAQKRFGIIEAKLEQTHSLTKGTDTNTQNNN